MDKNIVSFIESIEPDFSYQGTEGAMALIVESNDNMLVIESYLDGIETQAIQEGLYSDAKDKAGAAYGWAKEKAKKAIDYIIKAIKVAIAKIKALFFQMVKKIKVLYAQAANKVGDLMSKLASKDISGIKVDWKELQFEKIRGFVSAFHPAQLPEVKGLKADAAGADEEDASKLNLSAKDILKKCVYAGGVSDESIDSGKITEFLKDKCFEARTEVKGGVNALKESHDKIVDVLKELYKNIMDTEAAMLRDVSTLRKEADRHSVSYANKVVNAVNAACTMFFNAVFSVVVTGMHQRIKAVVYAIKHRAGKGIDAAKEKAVAAKDTVVEKAKGAKDWVAEKVK